MLIGQIHIYATTGDWCRLLTSVWHARALVIASTGLFSDASLKFLKPEANPMPFGGYLVVNRGVDIAVREVPQRRGGTMYAVDQLLNPNSVTFDVGGMADPNRLVVGRIATLNDGSIARDLYSLFSKEAKKQFTLIKSCYVGAEANAFMMSGGRLSPTKKSPPEYDLSR